MSSKSPELYLVHILDSIEAIESYATGLTYDEFLATENLQDAFCYRLAIIGEAAGKLPAEFKQSASEIPWSDVIGLRNVIVHEYMHLNLDIIWKTAIDDLPKLKRVVSGMLEQVRKG